MPLHPAFIVVAEMVDAAVRVLPLFSSFWRALPLTE
jgi:hypothetical protein